MRRWAAVAFGPVALIVVVLGIEVELARRAPTLDGPPLDLDGTVGAPGADSRRVVWLGDSTAAGVGVDRVSEALPVVVADRLGGPVELTVLAESGAQVADVVGRQLAGVASARPDLVFVSVGANDVVHLSRVGEFRRHYEKLLAGLPDGVEVVLLGVPDMGSPTRLAQPLRGIAGWRGRRLDREVRAVAAETGATYVDIAGETGPLFRRRPGRYFAADRFHPSADGQALWADAVVEALDAAG